MYRTISIEDDGNMLFPFFVSFCVSVFVFGRSMHAESCTYQSRGLSFDSARHQKAPPWKGEAILKVLLSVHHHQLLHFISHLLIMTNISLGDEETTEFSVALYGGLDTTRAKEVKDVQVVHEDVTSYHCNQDQM